MVFAQPQNLFLFALLIPLAGAWIFYSLWYRKVRARAGDSPLITAMTSSVDQRGQILRRISQFMGMILLIVALSQPQWGMTDEEVEQQSMDIVFALDLSRSMLAEDVAPDRLSAANKELRETMSRLKGDRVGLVIFTSISFIQSPLTTDYSTIDFFLRRLHPDQLPVGGTSIGAAMQDSIEVLQGRSHSNRSESNQMTQAENQVVVLLTDGEDHESSPTAAAEQARDLGIRVVTVGVGSREGAQIPDFDDRGRRRGNVRDADGSPVVTHLDEENLRQMAQLTGGTYIHFDRPGQVSDQLVAYLDELERTTFETLMTERYVDRFHYFLIPGFLLLFLSLFLGNRKSTTPGRWRSLLPLSLLLIALVSTGCDSAFQQLDPSADSAAEAMARGSYEEALEHLDYIADSHGDRPEYHFNRGRALLGMENNEGALESFARALTTDAPHLRADVHYHLGLAMSADENWRDAHDSFSRGLQLFHSDESLTDPELRRALQNNLEIALRELFPPCSTFEDDLEPNDQLAEPTILEELAHQDLTLCGGNDDYFAIGASPNSTLSIDISLRQLREEPDPEHIFLTRPSAVELTLLDSTGQTVLRLDQGQHDDEDAVNRQNRQQTLQREIQDFHIASEHLQNQPEGPLFIQLSAAPGLEFAYDLDINYIPSCETLDDQYEPNSTAEQAAELDTDSPQLHLCPEDEDWFRIEASRGDSFFVDVTPQPDLETETPPELTVELRRADNQALLSTGQLDGNYLTAGIQNIEFDADILLRVVGTGDAQDEQQGPYSLDLYHIKDCDDPNYTAPELAAGESEYRYLRLCDDEVDTYRTAANEEGNLEWVLRTLPSDAWRGDPELDQTDPFDTIPEMDLLLISIADREVIAEALTADPTTTASAQPTPLTRDKFLTVEAPNVPDDPIIQVEGEPGFYHLRRVEDEEEQDEEESEEEQEDSEDDESEDGEDDESEDGEDDESEDGEDGEDSEEDEAESEQDEGEESEEEQSQDGQEEDEEEDNKEDGNSASQESEEEENEVSAEHQEILRSLENSDQNFQLHQRLKDIPRRQIERDW